MICKDINWTNESNGTTCIGVAQQWHILKPLIPLPKAGGRPRTVNIREIVNAMFYILASGCTWRLLPHDLPP